MENTLQLTQTMLEGLYKASHLEMPQEPSGRARGCGWGERSPVLALLKPIQTLGN